MPSELTLADLEAVEKAGENATERPWNIITCDPGWGHALRTDDGFVVCNTVDEFNDSPDLRYIALAANHAVEMSMALREAVRVVEAATAYHDNLMSADKPTGWLEFTASIAAFRRNWPGLFPDQGNERL